MFKNCHYDNKKSKMFLWEQVNGADKFEVIDWTPYVYVPDERGTTQTIDGVNVSRRDFDNFYEYKDFQDKYGSVIYENEMAKEIQFLCERYHHISDTDIVTPVLKIYSLDIETRMGTEFGSAFPKPSLANHPITLINVRCFGGQNISWGVKNYTGEPLENNIFVSCTSEVDMLQRFFTWWRNNAPDVVTGWNIAPNSKTNARGGFDLAYLINRSKVLFGEDNNYYKMLSPINIVRTWEDSETQAINVSLAGISIIDYLSLYKWYSPKHPDNYKLDTISLLELEVGKLDYSEYGNLDDLFHKNWNMYVEYNMIDNKRIEELEDKLGYIRLAQNLTVLCKCKLDSYMTTTALVEGAMLMHYRRNNLCAPRFTGGAGEWFPAAYVKQPDIGRHSWVVDLDVTSSYPTAIITLNMSPETYYGRIISYVNDKGNWVELISENRREDDIEAVVESETPITLFTAKREFPVFKIRRDTGITVVEGKKLESFNNAIKKGLICVAPCGSMFMTNKKGHFAMVELEMFGKRVTVKSKMNEIKKTINTVSDAEKKRNLSNIAANLNAMQTAFKLFLNGAYGVTSVPYSRYFNVNISEAITSCGRRAVKNGEKFVNELLNNPVLYNDLNSFMKETFSVNHTVSNEKHNDFVAYIDTDSLFIKCAEFFKSQNVNMDSFDNLSEDEKINIVLKFSSIVEKYVNDRSYIETQLGCYNSQVKKDVFSLAFKQEVVCRSALFVKKKKYGFHMVNKEHVPCDSIEVTGMEIIRSETPSAYRIALKELLSAILKGESDEKIIELYNKHKDISKNSKVEEISENKGIKGIETWAPNGECLKGAPYHVKAAVNYHKLLDILNVKDKYPEIQSDTKNKLVSVVKNPYGFQKLMYDEWPKEFTDAGIRPDYEDMENKFLRKKLIMLLTPMNKQHILDQNPLFDLFFG